MSLRVRPNARAVALLGSLSFAAACGGTVSDVNGRNGRLSGAGGGGGGGVKEDGGSISANPPRTGSAGTGGFWHSEPWVTGGTTSGYPESGGIGTGGYGTGGAGGFAGTGGEWGFPGGFAGSAGGWADAGPPGSGGSAIYVPISPTCGYSFASRGLGFSCTPTDGCLNLDPSAWSPVVPASGYDGGLGAEGSSPDAAFCQAPVPGQTYTFAFDELVLDATYTSFNVVTGTTACEGYEIAYLGYPSDDNPPRGSARTHCFSVDGRFLQSRLAVTDYGSPRFTNLRVVSSCPCTRQIPYNTETCPPPNGSAGAPNCN